VRFDLWSRATSRATQIALVVTLSAALSACSDGPRPSGDPTTTSGWPAYGGTFERTFFNADEQLLTPATVGSLVPRWRFLAGAIVTAEPVLADVDRPGEGTVRMLFVTAWDGYVYALRAKDGSLAWAYRVKKDPGSDYGYASSGAVVEIDGRKLLYVGANMTLYGLDAATGALVWAFDAGTGCTTCDRVTERNQVESSPAVADGMVFFGMDVNELSTGKGGLYAVDARRGTLVWYFDPETAATCHTQPGDEVRRFDGYHTAEQLGLPEDFFATRPGCDFDRSTHGCGGVWSSMAVDPARRLLYADTSNCDPFAQGAPGTPGVMPPYGEAIFSLTFDGDPAWRYQPRLTDVRDLDFGATPNLFSVEIGGQMRDVLGVGGKDGTYYVLDRDGVNQITGKIEPYWQTNVVEGGGQGGVIGSAAVGDGMVFFSTAPGTDTNNPQRPTVHALDAATGAVRWQLEDPDPSFASTTAIPGVVFTSALYGHVQAWDAATGAPLASVTVGGPLSGSSTVLDGNVYVGSGSGARSGSPEFVGSITSWIPSPINAYCIAGTEGCPEDGRCNDANDCTTDTLAGDSCTNTPVADGTSCRIGANQGECRSGSCTLANVDCDDGNMCTQDIPTATGCRYVSLATGTPCTARGVAGTCRSGSCFVTPAG
jgi:polyvinyl alcohol dehydrogenase (cytochrome)